MIDILTSEMVINVVAILIGSSLAIAGGGIVLFMMLLRQHLRGRREDS